MENLDGRINDFGGYVFGIFKVGILLARFWLLQK
jgi:hypothetical protein